MTRGKKSILSRRDFLKVATSIPATYFSLPILNDLNRQNATGRPGVIILVFDALSADNMHLYNYPLDTMPNLDRFASQATVYHNHYSAGTFTVPGTASLLSGMYPWSHRAFSLGGGGVADEHVANQIFSFFEKTHYTLGYAQNKYADNLLNQFSESLRMHIPHSAFDYENRPLYDLSLFKNDGQIAFSSFDDNIVRTGEGLDASLAFGPLLRVLNLALQTKNNREFKKLYPDGLPDSTEQFLLSDLIDGAIESLGQLDGSSLSYFHFHPPHHPYRPTAKYTGSLFSIFAPPEKPEHLLSVDKRTYVNMRRNRQAYDEYLLSWDEEAGRLFEYLRSSGMMENNYIVITSDHGEMFERGEVGHFNRLMYSPLIHIPLIISRPGQIIREDIYTPTSSIDVLPTLSWEIFDTLPAWVEGKRLPGFGGDADEARSIFTMDAKQNPQHGPLRNYSIALTKEKKRLIAYQYQHYSQLEFYDLETDPEEMDDLFPKQPRQALDMKDELLTALAEANRKFGV